MAPSQMEHHQEQSLGHGYTHKKFNCGYSHKKLGMRLRQREGAVLQNNKENIEAVNNGSEITRKSSNAPSRGLFRPYALGEDTPRKRKVSRDSSSESSDEETHSQQQQHHIASPSSSPVATYYHQHQQPQQAISPAATMTDNCPAPALSPNSYAQRLQRQRAALYMRYMQQFHAGGQAIQAHHISPEAPVNFTSHTLATYHHHQQQPMGYANVNAPIFNGC
ncbi:uncharacterized protein LOC142227458 [Haematobia irritans]|uniref:uncharacterized protein LOC142227458 n=1 Tax=Haematobia irritans TaxID=7368 RepID=UPI003F50565E